MSFRFNFTKHIPLIAKNGLQFVCFFLIIVSAQVGMVSAHSPTVCRGTDIVAAMREEAPAKYAALEALAAEIPFGQGLFWQVTAPNGAVSHVYGTIHLSDISVPTIPTKVLRTVRSARLLATEIGGLADGDLIAEQLVLQMGKLFIGSGQTLKSLLTNEDYERLDSLLADRGVPLISLIGFRPFVVLSLLGIPSCELSKMSSGGGSLDGAVDQRLAETARDAAVPNIGLETLAEQVDVVTSVPLARDVEFLEDFIRSNVEPDDLAKTLVSLYMAERMDLLIPLMDNAELGGEGMQMPAQYRKALLTNRNHLMFNRALPELERGRVFVAVGALHLPGNDGILSLLDQAGYRIERVPLQGDE